MNSTELVDAVAEWFRLWAAGEAYDPVGSVTTRADGSKVWKLVAELDDGRTINATKESVAGVPVLTVQIVEPRGTR